MREEMATESKKGVPNTKILSCDCKNEFQDKEYGKGKRVCNTNARGAKCTVCGSQHLIKE